MKLVNEIERILAYLPNKDIVLNKDNEVILLKTNLKKVINKAFGLFDLDTEILVLDDLNMPFFLTLDLNLIKKEFDFKVFYVNFPYLGLYKNKPINVDFLYNYNLGSVIFQTENSLNGLIVKNNVFFTDDITCRNINNGEILWQYDILSIEGNPHNDVYNQEAEWKVKKFIGVSADKLWVALNHHTILAIDINTGILVHRIDHIVDFNCGWLPSAIPLPEATVIDEKNNVLIGFMWEFYWEINPIDGTLTFMDLTEELKQAAIRNDLAEFVLTDDSIYFASHPSESKIGLLDRQSKKVTWSYEFKTEEGEREVRIMQLQGNEEKIGALSSAKTLYIFERE